MVSIFFTLSSTIRFWDEEQSLFNESFKPRLWHLNSPGSVLVRQRMHLVLCRTRNLPIGGVVGRYIMISIFTITLSRRGGGEMARGPVSAMRQILRQPASGGLSRFPLS